MATTAAGAGAGAAIPDQGGGSRGNHRRSLAKFLSMFQGSGTMLPNQQVSSSSSSSSSLSSQQSTTVSYCFVSEDELDWGSSSSSTTSDAIATETRGRRASDNDDNVHGLDYVDDLFGDDSLYMLPDSRNNIHCNSGSNGSGKGSGHSSSISNEKRSKVRVKPIVSDLMVSELPVRSPACSLTSMDSYDKNSSATTLPKTLNPANMSSDSISSLCSTITTCSSDVGASELALHSSQQQYHRPQHQHHSSSRHSNVSEFHLASLRVCCVSDTHGQHRKVPALPDCDVFIHSGDIFLDSRKLRIDSAISALEEFNEWLGTVPAKHRIVVAGNHDTVCETLGADRVQQIMTNAHYLCNSFTTVMGLCVYGTPYSSGCSKNMAFKSAAFREDMMVKYRAMKTAKVDILVSHGPSHALTAAVKPKLVHVWGHVHEFKGIHFDAFPLRAGWGEGKVVWDGDLSLMGKRMRLPAHERITWLSVCACVMDSNYAPVQIPTVVDIATSSSRLTSV